MPTINLHNCDCMDFMRGLPDKAYQLAIVDPPYGIGGGSYGINDGRAFAKTTIETSGKKDYDVVRPSQEYFEALRRVSCNQIIWGGNHFADLLPASPSWVVWDKCIAEGLSLSAAELAWCSIGGRVAKYTQLWAGMWRKGEMAGRSPYGERIHPNQKPVALYRWLLQHYAKPGDKILDTHGGSMSIAIACDIEGFDLDLCELDKDYFAAGKKRLEMHQAQPRMFDVKVEAPQQMKIA